MSRDNADAWNQFAGYGYLPRYSFQFTDATHRASRIWACICQICPLLKKELPTTRQMVFLISLKCEW